MYLQGLDGLYSLVKSEDLQWTTSIRRLITSVMILSHHEDPHTAAERPECSQEELHRRSRLQALEKENHEMAAGIQRRKPEGRASTPEQPKCSRVLATCPLPTGQIQAETPGQLPESASGRLLCRRWAQSWPR
ncbi:uncharacterized protein LOC144577399 isoform X1 [Callithrix jacchus]